MKKTFILSAVAALLFSVPSAFAESSGWINANELESFSRSVLNKQDKLPVRIRCKNKNTVVGMNRKNTMVNVTYRNSPKEVDWTWAWGTDVGRIGKKRMKQGFKRVSYDSFRRKSGLKIGCAIWHK